MNASELEEILNKTDCVKNSFGGIHPLSDLLTLELKQYPRYYITNVKTNEKPETQRMAFYFIDDQNEELFDSHRIPPHRYKKYFEDFLDRNAAQWPY